MERGYRYGFSSTSAAVHDVLGRERKAKTMVCVLKDFVRKPLADLSLLNVGCSSGIIDNYLANHFRSVLSIDIDEPAIRKAILRKITLSSM